MIDTSPGSRSWSPGRTINGNGSADLGTPSQAERGVTYNEREIRVKELLANALVRREEFLQRWAEPKNDLFKSCRYPSVGSPELSPQYYKALYDRDPIAARIVELWPTECAQVSPKVYESEDSTEVTAFERAWDMVSKELRGTTSYYQDEEGSLVWKYVLQADILSRIGSFGIILLGINDGRMMDQPIEGCPLDGFSLDMSGATSPTSWNPAAPVSSPDTQSAAPTNQPQNKPPWQIKKDQESWGETYEQQLYKILGTDAQYYQGYTSTPVGGMTGLGVGADQARKLLWLRCYDESLVQIVSWEGDLRSKRWNQPLYYNVTLVDPRQPHTGVGRVANTIRVHWSRIIHVADTDKKARPDEVFAQPTVETSLNRVLDIRKILGANGEAFWMSCFMGISFESNPQLGGEVQYDKAGLAEQIKKWEEGFSRFFALTGFTAKTLSAQVVDPSPHINAHLEQICIHEACPKRVFMGSERGELASSQDDSKWNDRLMRRNKMYVTPCIIVPLIDRLIMARVLPKPKGYSVWWPDIESTSAQTKAMIASQKTTALAQFINAGISTQFQFEDFLTRIMDFSEEEAQTIISNAEKDIEDQGISAMSLKSAGGLQGILSVLGQVQQGQLSKSQAMEIFEMVLGIEPTKAETLLPEHDVQPPPQPSMEGQPPQGQPPTDQGQPPQPQPEQGQEAQPQDTQQPQDDQQQSSEGQPTLDPNEDYFYSPAE